MSVQHGHVSPTKPVGTLCRLSGLVVWAGCLNALTACSGMPAGALHGEQVAYHVFNATDSPVIYALSLSADQPGGRLLYANVQSGRTGAETGRASSWVRAEQGAAEVNDGALYAAYDPFGSRLAGFIIPPAVFDRGPTEGSPVLPRPLAGVFRAVRQGHRVPDYISVQWHEAAQPGRGKHSGRLRGPFRYALRASIPPRVLARLAQSWRYRLELAVAASSGSPRVLWRLGELTDQGMQPVEQGQFVVLLAQAARPSE